MRCVLLYNPASGRQRSRRVEQVGLAAKAIEEEGHAVEIVATLASGSAGEQAKSAALAGADVVFACGGDGTVHEVLQGLVNKAGEPRAALGIVPLGTANALARHLKLPLDPVKAALQQIRGTAQTIPAGRVEYGDQARYFLVMAGAGPDGALVYSGLAGQKSRLGRWAYYLRAARLFATRRFRPFGIEFAEAGSSEPKRDRVVCAMAVGVDDLGGLFSRLVKRRASGESGRLQLAMVRPPAILSLPLWFAFGWLNRLETNPWVRFAEVTVFSCWPLAGVPPHLQADGEWLGRIPMRVTVVPDAVRILLP